MVLRWCFTTAIWRHFFVQSHFAEATYFKTNWLLFWQGEVFDLHINLSYKLRAFQRCARSPWNPTVPLLSPV